MGYIFYYFSVLRELNAYINMFDLSSLPLRHEITVWNAAGDEGYVRISCGSRCHIKLTADCGAFETLAESSWW